MEIENILKNIPDKQYKWKATTSLKWKRDLFNFLGELDDVLEIGTNQGWTAYLLSFIAKNVYTIEFDVHNLQEAKKHCDGISNIHFIHGDAYNDDTYTSLPKTLDAVVIDCIHDYEHVIKDINRALSYTDPDKGIYLIFDDYSHPDSVGVKQAIDYAIEQGLSFECHLGHEKDYTVNRNDGTSFTLTGPEGIILSYGK